jgi:DNA-binding GntR family transcriptional regulator
MLSEKINKLHYMPIGLAEGISRNLMNAILNGTLEGGEQLIEAELQQVFGVSKSPVREALRDLEKKGLVEIKPRRGAFVKAITRRDITENYRVRAVLEGLAAREAYEKMTPEHFVEMKQILEKMVIAAKKNSNKDYWDQHHLFHSAYLKICDNRILIELLERLRMHNLWYNLAHEYYNKDFDFKEDVELHVEIVKHLERSNVKGNIEAKPRRKGVAEFSGLFRREFWSHDELGWRGSP